MPSTKYQSWKYTKAKPIQPTNKLHCPKNHTVQSFSTEIAGYGCDLCGKHYLPEGSLMFGCRKCNWDCCSRCFHANNAAMENPTKLMAATPKFSPVDWSVFVRIQIRMIFPSDLTDLILMFSPSLVFAGNHLQTIDCIDVKMRQISDLVFDDKKLFIIGVYSQVVTLLHIEDCKVIQQIPGGEGGHYMPISIAVSEKYLYVIDYWYHSAQIFQKHGDYKYIKTFGGMGSEFGQMKRPKTIRIASHLLFITDTGNNRIQVFNQDGNFVRSWKHAGTMHALAVDEQHVYVSDGKRLVTVETHEGILLKTFLTNSLEFGMAVPWSLGVMNGFLYIYDNSNGRVLVFNELGHLVHNWDGLCPTKAGMISVAHDRIFVLQKRYVQSFT